MSETNEKLYHCVCLLKEAQMYLGPCLLSRLYTEHQYAKSDVLQKALDTEIENVEALLKKISEVVYEDSI